MNRELLSKAVGDIDDRFVAEARFSVPGDTTGSPERIVHMKKKRIITFALAAALILALGVGAYAAGLFGGKPEITVHTVDHDDIDWLPDYANEIANTTFEPHDNAPTAEIAAMLAELDKGERSKREFGSIREMEKTYGIELLKAGSGERGVEAVLQSEEHPIVYDIPADGELPADGAHLICSWISWKDGVCLSNICFYCFNNPYYRQIVGFPLTKTEAAGEYEIRSLGVTASLVSGWNDMDGQTVRLIVAYFSYDGVDYRIMAHPKEGHDISIEWLCALLETLHK